MSSTPQLSFGDRIKPFFIGGSSGMMATCVIQPIDMVKVRIQLKSEQIGKGAKVSPFGVINEMMANGKGIGQFYRGLDSALIRQITYTTTRMGIYKSLMNHHTHQHGNVSLGYKMLFSATAGFIGSLVGNPADLILVRLQADQTLPEAQRRNYKNFNDAFKRIIKEEGVMNLWKGSTPTVVRAVVLNLGMLAPFDEAKERLIKFYGEEKETASIRVQASLISGFLASFMSLPFDNAKTKMQKMTKLPDGTYPYKNIFHTIYKTISNEGFTHLWVGFPTFYTRIAPHVLLTWMFMGFWENTVFAKKK